MWTMIIKILDFFFVRNKMLLDTACIMGTWGRILKRKKKTTIEEDKETIWYINPRMKEEWD